VNTISHEFRTPLSVILFAAAMMKRYDQQFGPEERAEQVADIEEAVARMNDLVEQSLSLGRAEASLPELRAFDVSLLCHRIIDEVASATSHRSPISFEEKGVPLPVACSDESMLRSILSNLVSNAVKYSPAGTQVVLRLARDNDRAIFTVRDHGAGLNEADIPKLFTTFHRGSNTAGIVGSGLGLAIVRRCAEALGGSVLARNADGGGAEFVVVLPRFFTTP
jgi:signal transduction histidine kinase